MKKKHKTFRYVQLCHNYRDPETGVSKTKVLYNFGPAESLDTARLRRLVNSLSRHLQPDDVVEAQMAAGNVERFEFKGARDLGNVWVLDALWSRIGAREAIEGHLPPDTDVHLERVIFALVAYHLLGGTDYEIDFSTWVESRVHIPGLEKEAADQCEEATNALTQILDRVRADLSLTLRNRFRLDTDVVFIIRIDGADPLQPALTFAVTRCGFPIGCWSFAPDMTSEEILALIKASLVGWPIRELVRIGASGSSEHSPFITCERVMAAGDNVAAMEASSRPGRYRQCGGGFEMKEIAPPDDMPVAARCMIIRHPLEGVRDRVEREGILESLRGQLETLDGLTGDAYLRRVEQLCSHSIFGPYLRREKAGVVGLNRATVRRAEHLDGKYIVRYSAAGLDPQDVVLGCRRFWDLQRTLQYLRGGVSVRPTADWSLILTWFALMLIQAVEKAAGVAWPDARATLATMQVGIHATDVGEIWQTTACTAAQRALLEKLGLTPPPRYLDIRAVVS